MSTIQANLISLVGTIASLAVAFGVFGETTEQVVIAAAGTLISIGFSLFAELRTKTVAQAKVSGVTVKGIR